MPSPQALARRHETSGTNPSFPERTDLPSGSGLDAHVETGFGAETTDSRHRALYLLKELGLSGEEAPAALSGGETRRGALARALAPSLDILLLDRSKMP